MKCPKCGLENDPSYQYCMNCASPLNVQQFAQPQYQSPLVKEKEKLLLPELILFGVALLVTLVGVIAGIVNLVRWASFFSFNSLFLSGITFFVLICCIVVVLMRNKSVKLSLGILSIYFIITFLGNFVSNFVSLIKYRTYTGVAFYLGAIVGSLLMLALAVTMLISVIKQNSGVSTASLVIDGILLAFILITFVVSVIGDIKSIKFVGALSLILDVQLCIRLILIYASSLLLLINHLKSLPKKQVTPVYQQQYYPPTNNF